jgi:hypothetical protein
MKTDLNLVSTKGVNSTEVSLSVRLPCLIPSKTSTIKLLLLLNPPCSKLTRLSMSNPFYPCLTFARLSIKWIPVGSP